MHSHPLIHHLHKGLLEHMKEFILELGKDFLFVDSEYGFEAENAYNLTNIILQDFNRGIAGQNRTRKGQKAMEKDIYLLLDFEQFVGDNIISLKDIKSKWDLYNEEQQEIIRDKVQKKFDTRVWVLLEAVNTGIDKTQKEKEKNIKNKEHSNGEDIDI